MVDRAVSFWHTSRVSGDGSLLASGKSQQMERQQIKKESLEICPTPLGYMHGGHLDAIVPAYSIWLMQGIGTSLSLFQMMFVCDLASNKSRLDEGHAYLGMFIVKSYYVHTEVGNIGTYVTTWGI